MKKQKINLKKPIKPKIIQLVEPSENLKQAYLQKSEDSLSSTRILLQNKK